MSPEPGPAVSEIAQGEGRRVLVWKIRSGTPALTEQHHMEMHKCQN